MGSGGAADAEPCAALGRWLAGERVHLLTGSLGTRSEIELAIRDGKPAVGYLTDRTGVLDIPDAVPVFSTLEPIQRFVRRALGRAP